MRGVGVDVNLSLLYICFATRLRKRLHVTFFIIINIAQYNYTIENHRINPLIKIIVYMFY